MTGLFKVVMHSYSPDNPQNEFINVFGYKSFLAVTGEEQALADEFTFVVADAVADIISVAMRINRVEVFNVTDGVGYWDKNLSPETSGTRTGEFVSSFTAWGYRYNRLQQGKRHGYKRFGEISESDTFGNVPTSGMQTVLDTVAGILGLPLNEGIVETWFPVILERKETGVYPWTSHDILDVTFERITTQNSRKR